GQPIRPIAAEFRALGGAAAREGGAPDAPPGGLGGGARGGRGWGGRRVARVAWRCLCEADAGLDRRELSRVGEAIFVYLDELAAACAQGYAEARVQAAGGRQARALRRGVLPP